MKTIIILVPNAQHNLISVSSAYKILNRAEGHWQSQGNDPRFNVKLAGPSKQVKLDGGLFTLNPMLLQEVGKVDLIIIPSLDHVYVKAIKTNEEMVRWIREQYKRGAEVASICTGAFLLAATGLLDGMKCSTHWVAAHDFKRMFPKVKLAADQVVTDYNGIYTNGGAFSFLNLMLYLIEKYYDRQTAIFCSKIFQIDIDRDSQSAFTIFTGLKNHNDRLVKKAQNRIENNYREKIVFEKMATKLAVSRRNFDRRFIDATGYTPVEYWQRVKVEAAKRNFETSRKNVNEVMYDSGYADAKAFRNVFRKITGLTPVEYRSKYSRDAY